MTFVTIIEFRFVGIRCQATQDDGHVGKLIEYVYYWYLIVKRSDPLPGFKVLPRRWVVERTFGWLMNYRRLCRHYEYWPETGEAMVKIAMIHVMIRRLA